MKKFKESHTSGKLIKISSVFSPVNLAWSRVKGKAPSKQLQFFYRLDPPGYRIRYFYFVAVALANTVREFITGFY